MNNRLIKSNDAGGGACTNTVDLYNPFPDGGGVALYQLNGDATDVSGNYDGTASNVTYGAGQFGQAGVFNGSNSQISYSNQVVTNGETSVSFWYNPSSTTQVNYLIGNGVNTADKGITIGYNGGTNQFFGIVAKGTSSLAGVVVSNATYSNNGWYNIVFVWDGTTSTNAMKLYVNNFLDGENTSDTSSGSIGSYSSFNIGGVSGSYSQGSIDQVRIFSRALRPYEVEALYTEEYCTPTIVPSEHFNTVTYTGNGTGQSISSLDFAPDLVWVKSRSYAQNHLLQDTVRGIGSLGGAKILYSDGTFAEATNADSSYFSSFDSNGFTVGSNVAYNGNGSTYVAWNFKAGGSAVTNTDGTITSQVSANTEAGFSVVSYTGNQTNATVGHGLGVAPKVVIVKGRDYAQNWAVYHYDIGTGKWLQLNGTTAALTENIFGGVHPNSSTFSLNGNVVVNKSGGTNIAYCFAEVEGFSNFGSYVGNGTSKTILTGFEPAFVMFKVTSEADHWLMFDNKRGVVTDETGTYLIANLSQAEGSILPSNIKFLANGFEITGSGTYWNKANADYIYMAFAADPTTIEPSLEDSFNTVTMDRG